MYGAAMPFKIAFQSKTSIANIAHKWALLRTTNQRMVVRGGAISQRLSRGTAMSNNVSSYSSKCLTYLVVNDTDMFVAVTSTIDKEDAEKCTRQKISYKNHQCSKRRNTKYDYRHKKKTSSFHVQITLEPERYFANRALVASPLFVRQYVVLVQIGLPTESSPADLAQKRALVQMLRANMLVKQVLVAEGGRALSTLVGPKPVMHSFDVLGPSQITIHPRKNKHIRHTCMPQTTEKQNVNTNIPKTNCMDLAGGGTSGIGQQISSMRKKKMTKQNLQVRPLPKSRRALAAWKQTRLALSRCRAGDCAARGGVRSSPLSWTRISSSRCT